MISTILTQYLHEHVHAKCVAGDRATYATKALTALLGTKTPQQLNRKVIERYCTKRGVSNGTLRRELGVLVAALNHAVREKRLSRDDMPHIPMPEEPAPKDRWLTKDEANALLKASRFQRRTGEGGRVEWVPVNDLTRCYLFIMIGLHTGARKAAIEQLLWSQVDLDRGRIQFNPPGRVQTKKRRAVVPISDKLFKILNMVDEQEGYVIGGKGGTVRTCFETAVKRAGLEEVTPHTLRHTWATWAAQAGTSMWEIAGVLGDTIATVEKRYAHHHPDYLRAAVNFNNEE